MAAPTLTPDYASLMTEQTLVEGDRPPNKSPEARTTETDNSKHAKIRHPFWLTKPAPILFATVFAACGVALIVLDRSSRNGLPLSISASEYSWTYGPTAILVVILSFWRRIDYYYKSAQPWRELHAGPASTERSLLLDYISPIQVTSMFTAFRAKHHSVAVTILSFFLIKGITLVSTTLFVVKPTLQSGSFAIEYPDAFDASHVWSSPAYEVREEDSRGELVWPNVNVYGGGSDDFIWAYVARLNGEAKSDTKWNTQDGMVTQRLRLPDSTLNMTTLEAPVDVFQPNVTCEEAELSVSRGNPSWDSATCSTGPIYFLESRTYSYQRVNCSQSNNASSDVGFHWPGYIEDHDVRHVFSVALYDQDDKGPKLANSSSIICKIGYNIISANATWDLLTGHVTFAEGALEGQGKLLPNLSNPAFAEMLWTGLDDTASSLKLDKELPGGTETNRSVTEFSRVNESFLQLLVAKLGIQDDLDSLLDTSVLKDASISVFKGIATEFANKLLVEKKEARGTARGVVSEARLHTRPISLWTMVAGFFVLALLCCFLLLATSTDFWVPAMCGSIAGHAAVLANSRALQDFLKDAGHCRNKELKSKLQGMHFGTTDATGPGGFAVEITQQNPTPDEVPIAEASAKRKSWVPITGRFSYVVTAHVTAVLAIVGLEILQQLSDKRKGLLDMTNSDSTVPSYTIRLASTATVFAVATLFNCIDFTIVTFAPYSTLRSGRVPAERSILFHLLSVSPFLVLFRSLRQRQFGAAASNMSSLIGGFLTIIVSGLWVLNAPVVVESPSTATIGNWDASWLNGTFEDDAGAARALNLIRYGGSNTPTGIWNDLVLPQVNISSSTFDVVGRTANYAYNLGALRPTLNCTAIPRANISATWAERINLMPGWTYNTDISAQFALPSECVNTSSSGMTNLSFGRSIEMNVVGHEKQEKPGWIGRYIDLDTNAGKVRTNCPSVGVLFGHVEYTSNDTSKWNLTAFVCSQGIEQVPVVVTYTGNRSLELDEQHPPKPDSTAAWRWHNGSHGQALGSKLSVHQNFNLAPFPADQNLDRQVDPFFNHLLAGPDNFQREDLEGDKNIDKLIRAVTRDYSEYMRILIDRNFRANSNSTRTTLISSTGEASAKQPFSATTNITGIFSEEVTRLGIHFTSKVILQVLLGAMVIGGLASYALVKLDGTLPRNPCTIASTMAFLAGSQLCGPDSDIIPQGAEFMSDGQLKQVFDGWVFSLGWWHSENAGVEGSDETTNESGLANGDESSVSTISVGGRTNERFGVDVGSANVSKFDKDS
ncbi:hypothetical protein FDECE_3261 [Fusarium decemcellulare]|nr:hypothetical protein FDECE_3261 [Fusarium decemcellulare]